MTETKQLPKLQHEPKLVLVADVVPNEYNPNVMDDRTFEQVVKNIETEGFVYPIIVRPPDANGKYVIIDGFHRWKASQKLNYQVIPAIVLDKSTPEAMISTINFNKLRGEFDTLKLAEVVHTLLQDFSIEELEAKLGYNESEIQGLDELRDVNLNEEDENLGASSEPTETQDEQKFELVLTDKQMKVVESALGATGKHDQAEALVSVCLSYLKK